MVNAYNFGSVFMKISYKFHRIPGTQLYVIAKVYDLLGQPSYITNSTCRSMMLNLA